MFSLILHGRRQKLLISRFAVTLFRNASSFSSAATDVSPQASRKEQTFTVSYLVDSLGFTTKHAESISRKVRFDGKGNPDSVLNLFRAHGFIDSQISTIVTAYPGLLLLDAEKSLGPKLRFLHSRGASSSELAEIVSKVPKILGKKGDKTIGLYYDFVKDVIEADKSSEYEIEKSCHSWQEGNNKGSNKIRNVLVLRGLGMPQNLLFPLIISNCQPVYGKERFESSLKKVVDKGFDPTNPKFVHALLVFYQMSDETIEAKIDVFKSLGFAVGDVWAIFKKWPFSLKFSEKKITQTFETLKRCGLLENEVLSVLKKFPQLIRLSEQNIANSVETFIGLGFSKDNVTLMIKRFPQCLNLSAETVKTKTEFLVKKMNLPLKAVVSTPQVFGYNMEKRIVPRCNVIKTLMSKGLIRSKLPPSMSSVLAINDQAFLNKYVRKHDDKELVAELMSIFYRSSKAHKNEQR